MNFALWAVAIAPAWVVVRHFGAEKGEDSVEAIQEFNESEAGKSD